MADSDEALDLRRRARRRLIGAIALVLALVIVPPMVMDLEPKPVKTTLSVQIPPQDGAPLKPPQKAPEPVAAPPAEAAPPPAEARAAKPTEAAAEPRESSAPPKPAPPTAEKGSPEGQKAAAKGDPVARAAAGAAKKDEARRAEAILNAEAFVVPLGAFANRDNVKQLEGKLVKAGVKYYMESVVVGGAEQTRVRAGPYATKEDAEKAREKLQTLGLSPGTVVARQ